MNTILQFILKYALDFAFGKVQTWLSKKKKINKSKTETKQQVARLKRAISQAYDGDEVTNKQSKEIVESAKELMSNY